MQRTIKRLDIIVVCSYTPCVILSGHKVELMLALLSFRETKLKLASGCTLFFMTACLFIRLDKPGLGRK